MQSLPFNLEQVVFLSYTGAAVQVLRRQGLPAQTLHKFLFRRRKRKGKMVNVLRPPHTHSKLRLIVVDEFSMLTQPFLENLLTYNIPLLLVGDQNQLPAIGAPNIYLNHADFYLDQPMRQALDNPVLWAADRVRQGLLVQDGFYDGVLLVDKQSNLHPNWYDARFQFVCKSNRARARINSLIAPQSTPQIGDRIVFEKNDWDRGITNGTLGTITAIKPYLGKYLVDFLTEEGVQRKRYLSEFQSPSMWGQSFDWAWAVTGAKSQGGTFDMPGVVWDETTTDSQFSRRFTYTALTRFTGNYVVGWFRQ